MCTCFAVGVKNGKFDVSELAVEMLLQMHFTFKITQRKEEKEKRTPRSPTTSEGNYRGADCHVHCSSACPKT